MKIICPHCGHINSVRRLDRSKGTLHLVCKKCKEIQDIQIGVTSHPASLDKIDEKVYGKSLHAQERLGAEPPVKEARKPGARNYKRLIVASVAFILVIFIAMALGMYLLLVNSGAYRLARDYINTSDKVREIVGDGVRISGIPTGYIDTSGGNGKAELSFRIRGEKSSIRIRLQMKQTNGMWKVMYATYDNDSGEQKILFRGIGP